MKTTHMRRFAGLLAGLLLCLTAGPVAFAAEGGPVSPPIKGTVQSIDYVHHAITVDGRTYAVADNAGFTGIGGFAVLHVGMPIAYTLSVQTSFAMPGSAAPAQPDDGPPVITHITWPPN